MPIGIVFMNGRWMKDQQVEGSASYYELKRTLGKGMRRSRNR